MPSVRTVVRILIAGVLVASVTGVAGVALAAPISPAAPASLASRGLGHQAQSARTQRGASSPVSVTIDSMSPSFARHGDTIVVKGTITNHTGAAIPGAQVELLTASTPIGTRSELKNYANGTTAYPDWFTVGRVWPAPATLHGGASMRWSIAFPVTSAGYSRFGVYRLMAQALDDSFNTLGTERTFLPYWPGGNAAPKKLDIAWVWPLIDQPQGSACDQTLASDEQLAPSLAPGGRLNALLSAGLTYSDSTHLTWAVDPALLSDVNLMAQRYGYKVGGNADCKDTTARPADAAATQWLSQLRSKTANDPMFVTPYADPDVAALVHGGLDADLQNSFALGDSEANNIIGRSFGTSTMASLTQESASG